MVFDMFCISRSSAGCKNCIKNIIPSESYKFFKSGSQYNYFVCKIPYRRARLAECAHSAKRAHVRARAKVSYIQTITIRVQTSNRDISKQL